MDSQGARARRCSVYRGTGQAPVVSVDLPAPPDQGFPHRATIASRIPLGRIMRPNVICATPDLDVCAVVGLMMRHHVGCIPVVDERRRPIGMITKYDVVEQLHAGMRCAQDGSSLPQDLQARCADEVMMPIALTLFEHATIAHAAAMMISEDTHHVIAVSTAGEVVGVVSARDIVAWLVENDGLSSVTDAQRVPD